MLVAEMNQVEIFNMRKSILMGTREDVIKRRAKQAAIESVRSADDNRTSVPVRRIVTFNHPDAFK